MEIEFVDILLSVLYLTFMTAFGAVVWSVYRRNRKGAGRQRIQNGIHVRRLTLGSWVTLLLAVLIAWLLGRDSVASVAVATVEIMLAITTLLVLWSMFRRR